MPDDFGLKLGMGCLMSVLLFAAKCLVAWCTGDSELAMSTIDLGYLLFVGPFAIFACMTPIRALHQFLTESLIAHIIVGEVLANTLALPLIDPKTNFKMGPDMWVHHITSAISGIYCLYIGMTYPLFHKLGCMLAICEVTTALPISFRQALKSDRLHGPRSLFFACTMPPAFLWRTR